MSRLSNILIILIILGCIVLAGILVNHESSQDDSLFLIDSLKSEIKEKQRRIDSLNLRIQESEQRVDTLVQTRVKIIYTEKERKDSVLSLPPSELEDWVHNYLRNDKKTNP